jgi:hypothetical protein
MYALKNDGLMKERLPARYELKFDLKKNSFPFRFEAAALYGIENVIIVDYDEFLYCPVVNATAEAQGEYLYNYFENNKKRGVEQIEFAQRNIGKIDISVSMIDVS